jgi:hypothetical protein
VGEPVLLGGSPDYFNRSPVAMLGEDALMLFGGYTGATGQGQALHLRRVETTLWGDLKLQADPNSVSWPRLAPFGDEFVVAWVGGGQPGRVGLAKFTP